MDQDPAAHAASGRHRGWTPGQGHRARTFGALLLGVHDDQGRLRFVGHVGSGFAEPALADLYALLQALTRSSSPFAEGVPREYARPAHWVDR